MSLKWTSYVAPKPCKGGLKHKSAVFRVKSHFALRKSATKFLCVETVSDKIVRHSLASLSVRKWWVGTSPSTRKFGQSSPTPLQNGHFQFIFARSASAVTSSEKRSINTNRKSTRSFPMSLRWTVYVAPKPSRVAQIRSVHNLSNNLR